MASRKKTYRRSTRSDDALLPDAELDGLDDALDDDEDDLHELYGGAGRGASGRPRTRNLPHDWADFDYGGGLDADWR